jgi:hypothetical protein
MISSDVVRSSPFMPLQPQGELLFRRASTRARIG